MQVNQRISRRKTVIDLERDKVSSKRADQRIRQTRQERVTTLAVRANHWTPLIERQSVIFIAWWRRAVPVVRHRIYECPSGQPGSSFAFLTALCSPLINTAAYLVTPRQVAVRVTAAPTGAQPTPASFTPERRRVTDRPLKFSHRQWAREAGGLPSRQACTRNTLLSCVAVFLL